MILLKSKSCPGNQRVFISKAQSETLVPNMGEKRGRWEHHPLLNLSVLHHNLDEGVVLAPDSGHLEAASLQSGHIITGWLAVEQCHLLQGHEGGLQVDLLILAVLHVDVE